jgi:hypothetical protein
MRASSAAPCSPPPPPPPPGTRCPPAGLIRRARRRDSGAAGGGLGRGAGSATAAQSRPVRGWGADGLGGREELGTEEEGAIAGVRRAILVVDQQGARRAVLGSAAQSQRCCLGPDEVVGAMVVALPAAIAVDFIKRGGLPNLVAQVEDSEGVEWCARGVRHAHQLVHVFRVCRV